MRKTLIALSVVVALPAGAALADDDDCNAPRDQWQPREAALQVVEQNGWTVREFEIDDGCYEIEARDSSGREIEVKLDPATLEIVELEYEDDDDDRGATPNPAPAGSVAPPQNGLFGNGAPPQVQVN
jgi:hypothetical protein